MKMEWGRQRRMEKEGEESPKEEKPDLSCAAGILTILSKKTEAFIDIGVSGPWSRRLASFSVVATCAVILGGLICLLLGMRENPMVQVGVRVSAVVVYGFWLVRFFLWARRLLQTREIWRRSTLVRIVERNEAHAAELLACSEGLLGYVRDLLKDYVTKVNGRMDSIFSKSGVLPVFAIATYVWNNWTELQRYLSNHLDNGPSELMARHGVVFISVLLGWSLLMRLGVWWSMSNYTFQIEIVETALRLKDVEKDELKVTEAK
jgi:hypothetical protein